MKIIDKELNELLKNNKVKSILNKCYQSKNVCPKKEDVFKAFDLCKLSDVKIVIFGQDPYYQKNIADGLAFSSNSSKTPASLKNIFKQLKWEYNDKINFSSNCLDKWAKQGVLLLNTILTVEENKPLSHKDKGWDYLINEVIKLINKYNKKIVFLIWGNNAKKLIKLIDKEKHFIFVNSHPSPFSFNKNFYKQNIFKKANDILKSNNIKEVDWNI